MKNFFNLATWLPGFAHPLCTRKNFGGREVWERGEDASLKNELSPAEEP